MASDLPDPDWPPVQGGGALAVLVSGGLDSAVLLAEAAGAFAAVTPLFVRVGSVWEDAEVGCLTRFLGSVGRPALRPLVTLAMPVNDLYGPHWSLTGDNVPDAESADEAVYLPGRNVLLLSKALLWCHLRGVPALALATLAGNPFPDADAGFTGGFAAMVNRAVGGSVRVLRPYAELGLTKADVVRRGANLPLAETLSCVAPVGGRHCGRCNKCGERRAGFRAAGVPDPTTYEDRR